MKIKKQSKQKNETDFIEHAQDEKFILTDVTFVQLSLIQNLLEYNDDVSDPKNDWRTQVVREEYNDLYTSVSETLDDAMYDSSTLGTHLCDAHNFVTSVVTFAGGVWNIEEPEEEVE